MATVSALTHSPEILSSEGIEVEGSFFSDEQPYSIMAVQRTVKMWRKNLRIFIRET
jgi:hypothetical protein